LASDVAAVRPRLRWAFVPPPVGPSSRNNRTNFVEIAIPTSQKSFAIPLLFRRQDPGSMAGQRQAGMPAATVT